MPRRLLCALLLLSTLALSGCWDSVEIDDQCYLLTLAIDVTEKGDLQLTTEIPNVEDENAASQEEKKRNMASVVGRSFTEAIDVLIASVPRNVNLTQLKVLFISEDLARSDAFLNLLNDLLSYRGLRRMASVVICEGKASAFTEAMRAVAGLEMSKSLEIAISTYGESSYLVHTRLLELSMQMRGIYGTGMAATGAVTREYDEKIPIPNPLTEALQPGDYAAADMPHQGVSITELFGTALFDGTHLVEMLGGHQTQLMQFVRGKGDYNLLAVSFGEGESTNIIIRMRQAPIIHVWDEGGRAMIHIDLSLKATLTQTHVLDGANLSTLQAEAEALIIRDTKQLLDALKDAGLDPIGFSKVMSREFLTIGDWERYPWDEAYRNGEITLSVQVYLQHPSREPGGLPLELH